MLIVLGFLKDFKLELLTSPKGLNEQLSTEIARKFRESRERHLGESPQLRQSTLSPDKILNLSQSDIFQN